ncbi:MAG TPA: BTAD domain-containing putative transcriptional regulator, partial [Chthonomonadaceae bacterium]|nr:BTAD domain-containing putative transcriptional regulator [Chthonomonadaceae bacterium]
MTTAPNWQVNLFGRLSVQRGECNITNFRTAKVGLLLAVLAQGQDRAIRRDDLADRLWPDQPPEIGQNRLRVALSYLRDILEPVPDERGTVLLADRREVRLAPGAITIDTAEFEATLLKADLIEDVADRCAALESAIGKYHAQFLPEFDDVWVTTERERLSEVYQLALRRLIHVLISIKEFDRAVAIAEQAVQIDPCLEEAHRLLMLTYAKMGRPAASVRQYETLQRMLMARTESEPSIETREALDTISNRAQPPHRTGPRVARTTKRVRAKANPESRIPLQLTPLIGRDDCVSRILVMLKTPQTRLVNITGIAGVGKSRLAIAVAEELRSRGQAVMYLSLLGADGSESIVGQLASAGRTPSSPRATLLTRLTLALERRNVLIVLDNVEHLLAAASDVMRNVLQSCPGITFLITSRHRIGMAGEYNFPLRPLPTPSAQSDAAEIATSPSVRLWLDRVRAARPSFQLNDANCGDVAAVCSTLDGIPLAIELAAAWADVLTPRQIRGRLNRRFDVLVGRDPHMDRRHASLLAALDWSFDQLPSRTQRFFLRLGRFSCG